MTRPIVLALAALATFAGLTVAYAAMMVEALQP